jgi:hypothetical protein
MTEDRQYVDREGNIQRSEIRNDQRLLEEAKVTWEAWSDFRSRRARSRDYYRGKPQEQVYDPDSGQMVSETDLIEESGRIPIRINQVGPVIRNLKGQFRQLKTQRLVYGRNREDNAAAEQITEALRQACDSNQLSELDAQAAEELLVSGLYGWKTTYKWIPRLNQEDVYVQSIDPVRMFFNPDFMDRRLDDIRIIGELHDITIDDAIAQFSREEGDEERIRYAFSDNRQNEFSMSYNFGFNTKDAMDFINPVKPDLCRVIEVWRLEYAWRSCVHDRVTGTYEISDMTAAEVADLNMARAEEAFRLALPQPPPIEVLRRYEGMWHIYFMTTNGDILWDVEQPYWHESHPYTIGLAQMFDGEIWGLIEDLIDPQRLVNRITQAIDYMFGSSAKGVLLLPEDAIPEGVTVDEFASEWTKFNGVIKFRPKPGQPLPQQVTARAIPDGIFLWLETMQKNIRESSGVQGASLGMAAPAGTPGSLYQAQIQQSQTTNRDFIDSFFEVRRARDLKMVQVIAQFYDEVRNIAVSGRRTDGRKYIAYNPSMVRNINWDVIVTEAPDTAASRQLFEDYLTKFLDTNRLTFRQYLALSSHPKADAMQAIVERTNPLLMDQGVSPQDKDALFMQLQQQAQAGDPDAMALMSQAR